jgi:hypothetical protein
MSVRDDLLPAVSTEGLAALLAAAPDDQLTENLFFECKATVTQVVTHFERDALSWHRASPFWHRWLSRVGTARRSPPGSKPGGLFL